MADIFGDAMKAMGEGQPMDNNKQAVDIKGYRVLSEDEKAVMNMLKQKEQDILNTLEMIEAINPTYNRRSLDLARQEIQTGFMWAIRAVARPNGE